MSVRRLGRGLVVLAGMAAVPAMAQDVPGYGASLERFAYPAPVHWFEAAAGTGIVRMAYLDLAPTRPNGRTVLLLHGKNFCAATWYETGRALADAGYRVIAPDQVGFCKSSKPADFQYSFAALADLTLKLLTSLDVRRATVVGHSMGGMLAARLALMAPARLEQLVLVAPLGLADRLTHASYAALPQLLAAERRTTAASIKAYQLVSYYHGAWRPDYDRWVTMRAGMYTGADRELIVNAQARTSEIIATQPIVHELPSLAVPTTFVIGMLDGTGAGLKPEQGAVRAAPGSIPALAGTVASKVPGARLIELEGLGHAPQVEAPQRFQRALLDVLAGRVQAAPY